MTSNNDDPEIHAIREIVAAMAALDAEEQKRVLNYLVARYMPLPVGAAVVRDPGKKRPSNWSDGTDRRITAHYGSEPRITEL